MNPELRAMLRVAAPQMPPEVAWPIVDECHGYESMDVVPDAMLRLIKSYMPGERVNSTAPQTVAKYAREVQRKFNPNHEPAGSAKGGQFASASGGADASPHSYEYRPRQGPLQFQDTAAPDPRPAATGIVDVMRTLQAGGRVTPSSSNTANTA